jgi:hypothetical protein
MFLKVMIIFMIGIFSCGVLQAQDKVLSPQEIRKLVPGPMEGFTEKENSKGKLIQIGNLKYSLSEQQFSRGKQSIRILLFDYGDAPIMYSQATKAWKDFYPLTTDSTSLQPIGMELCTGWESYNRRNNQSGIYAGIRDRYFLTITGEAVDLGTLKNLLNQFHFDLFPK